MPDAGPIPTVPKNVLASGGNIIGKALMTVCGIFLVRNIRESAAALAEAAIRPSPRACGAERERGGVQRKPLHTAVGIDNSSQANVRW